MGLSTITVIKSLSNTSVSEIEATVCSGYTFISVCMGPREKYPLEGEQGDGKVVEAERLLHTFFSFF